MTTRLSNHRLHQDSECFRTRLILACFGGMFTLASLSPHPALAAEQLDELVVTAPDDNTDPQTGEVIEDESAVARTVIKAEQLTEGAAGIAKVLSRTVGVQTRGSGGFGSSEFLSIRAGTATQTGVYLDGIRLNGASNPAFDFSTLDALGLASAEVYRGGTPFALGSPDVGGAVNLISSRTNADPTGGTIKTQFGSFGSLAAHAGARTAAGPWRLLAAVTARHADNNYDVLDDNGTRFNTRDDEIEERLNADATRTSALARLSYQAAPHQETGVLIQASQRDSGVPTPRNNPDNRARFNDDALSLQASNTLDRVGAWNTRQTLYVNVQNTLYDDREGSIGLGSQLTESDARTTGLKLFSERLGDRGTLGLVLDVSQEQLDHRDRIRGGRDLDALRQSLNITSQYALWLPGDKLVVTPSLGWKYLDDEIQVSEQAAALRGTPEARTHVNTTPGIGIRAELGRKFSLRANATRVQRSPSFSELFGDSGLLLASPDLVSETGTNTDIALVWNNRSRSLGKEISLGVFHSRRTDLITTVYDSRGVGRAENIPGARISGIELELDLAITPSWSATANLTWQDTRQLSDFSSFDGKQIPGQARESASARIDWANHRWRAWYGLDHERGRYYDTANLLPARTRTLQRAGLTWTHDAASISLVLDNLGDVIVEDFRGFPHPGRAAHLSLTYNL